MKNTRITLNYSEAIKLKTILGMEIKSIDKHIEMFGDPNGTHAESRTVIENLYNKTTAAMDRILSIKGGR